MYLSCKISNSVLNYLEQRGDDFGVLYEQSRVPIELLSDSSRWVSAPDMEAFLELASQLPSGDFANVKTNSDGGTELGPEKKGLAFIQMVAHQGPRLHAWGVLDSVLRMMPEPREILNQPDKFLSYFISPKPPVENLDSSSEGLAFDLPLSSDQYPFFTAYMKASFEALPVYVGQPLASCTWEGIHLQIKWATPALNQNQVQGDFSLGSKFGDQQVLNPESQSSEVLNFANPKFNPSLFQNIISDLETNQRILEDERRSRSDLEEKIREQKRVISKLQKALTKARIGKPVIEQQLNNAANDVATLNSGASGKIQGQGTPQDNSNNTSSNNANNNLNSGQNSSFLEAEEEGEFSLAVALQEPRYQVEQNLSRLHDYMIRAQQLVMVLTSESGVTPRIKKAMKKLNWEFVKTQYPKTVSESMENLRKIHKETSCQK